MELDTPPRSAACFCPALARVVDQHSADGLGREREELRAILPVDVVLPTKRR
jgi:hypothetical protein